MGDTIRDIKGPLSFTDLTYLYIILAVLSAIIIIAVIVIFIRKKKKSKEAIIPPRPAHEIACEALKELTKKNLPETGKIHEYYFELSNIVRRYLENRFQLRAPEMTTEEFLSTSGYTEKLRPEHKSLLREFLSHCDMVKFAKYHPGEEEIKSSYEAAKKLVEETVTEGVRN